MSMPRLRASRFPVPRGTRPIGVPVPARTSATQRLRPALGLAQAEEGGTEALAGRLHGVDNHGGAPGRRVVRSLRRRGAVLCHGVLRGNGAEGSRTKILA